jgi:glycosyltransferase involved in cell wall biosynthesis
MKIAFVTSWYGDKIPGGAEQATRGIAKNLTKQGVKVEILTTCVEAFNSDWNINFHEPGVEMSGDITVRRFLADKRKQRKFDRINCKLMQGQRISHKEEKTFFKEIVNSKELYKYIRNNGDEYDMFLFIPYMFGTTYFGSQIHPEKSIVIPCMHDESYAYMTEIKKMCESVKGLIYLSKPEKKFAENILKVSNTNSQVLGLGVDELQQVQNTKLSDISGEIEKEQYILYAGRKDEGKNIYLLLDYFQKYKEDNKNVPLKLVLIGGGKLKDKSIKKEHTQDVVDLGFVSLEEKSFLMENSLMLCQPSVHESFSIVIMESWLGKRPVLVHEGCAVTKNFCKESNGGLYFNNYEVFNEMINYALNNLDILLMMGENGKKYVQENLMWDIVTNNYIRFIEEIK